MGPDPSSAPGREIRIAQGRNLARPVRHGGPDHDLRQAKPTNDGHLASEPVAPYEKLDQFWPYTEAQFEAFKYGYKDAKRMLDDCTPLLAKK